MRSLPTNFSLSPRRQLIRSLLIIAGLGYIVFGFFRGQDTGVGRTLWIIDNSLSMAVTDISSGGSGVLISRLDRAKQIILSGSLLRSGEQAIMSAALGGRLELPMTDDIISISRVVQGIVRESHGGGSSVRMPLEMARLIYGSSPRLSIIWITDGEFSDITLSSPMFTLTGELRYADITLIGVGTRSGGPILLGYDTDGRARYKESDNKRVNSIRDDARLASVADSLDAELILLDSPSDLTRIAKSPDSNIIPPYLMMIGVLLIVAGLMVSRFRHNKNPNGK